MDLSPNSVSFTDTTPRHGAHHKKDKQKQPMDRQQYQKPRGLSDDSNGPFHAITQRPNSVMPMPMDQQGQPLKPVKRPKNEFGDCCQSCATCLSICCCVLTFPVALFVTIKIVQEHQRAIIFRMGRVQGGPRGPGTFIILPCIDEFICLDMRTTHFDIPPQEILTKDSLSVLVDAVVFFRVSDAILAVTQVENYRMAVQLLAATTLRNVLGTKNMNELLSGRENIANLVITTLDAATDPWGIKVERVEIKDVKLPVQMQRAMAAEAEAEREARAKLIAAEGEMNASRALKEAADIMVGSAGALQLRYLQTLNTISAEKNSTIIFPLPMEILSAFSKR